MSVALNTKLSRNEDILHAPVDADNAVMLDVVSGSYYGLNAVAARIWELLAERPMTIGEICARLCEEFEVDDATCEAAVLKFANTLIDNGVAHAVSP
jgi:hypothetical protein